MWICLYEIDANKYTMKTLKVKIQQNQTPYDRKKYF